MQDLLSHLAFCPHDQCFHLVLSFSTRTAALMLAQSQVRFFTFFYPQSDLRNHWSTGSHVLSLTFALVWNAVDFWTNLSTRLSQPSQTCNNSTIILNYVKSISHCNVVLLCACNIDTFWHASLLPVILIYEDVIWIEVTVILYLLYLLYCFYFYSSILYLLCLICIHLYC